MTIEFGDANGLQLIRFLCLRSLKIKDEAYGVRTIIQGTFPNPFCIPPSLQPRLPGIQSEPIGKARLVLKTGKRETQIRNFNQDTNAAGVWDPFPDPFQPMRPPPPPQTGSIFSQRVMDAVLTTVMGLGAVGIGGVVYQAFYEWNEVHKVQLAFTKPAPLLKSKTKDGFFAREEQRKINHAIAGHGLGKYYLLVGERGTGKTQLVLNAMDRIGHYGVVFTEAHSDSEVFKTRLGKALHYTYREDYVGQLFAREAPERGSALLDVEKAFNMIELVAVKYSRRRGRPLVLIINNIHAFKDDEDGEDLLELLQQRAESWAAAKLVTIIFNTDDYTVYERMKRDASRMEVIRVNNLGNDEAIKLLKQKRRGRESDEVIESIISRIGGRLLYINRLGRENNLVETADKLEEEERTWMTNTIGLIPDFEETAFEEQKYASCAWKLIRELIKSPTKSLPVNQCRIITGNPKWVRMLDHDNLIMIDDQQNVRPDSKILEKCFEEVVNSEGFDELLDNVCERVEEVDKEQRTRELIWSRKNDQTVRVGKPTKKVDSIKEAVQNDNKKSLKVDNETIDVTSQSYSYSSSSAIITRHNHYGMKYPQNMAGLYKNFKNPQLIKTDKIEYLDDNNPFILLDRPGFDIFGQEIQALKSTKLMLNCNRCNLKYPYKVYARHFSKCLGLTRSRKSNNSLSSASLFSFKRSSSAPPSFDTDRLQDLEEYSSIYHERSGESLSYTTPNSPIRKKID
ncbi:21474_t:CDS:10 [Entrophospora sp. SA101]|nr:21474_t:CDS:10 [Entrophospora sp. SA101]